MLPKRVLIVLLIAALIVPALVIAPFAVAQADGENLSTICTGKKSHWEVLQ